MDVKTTKNELQNILSGTRIIGHDTVIQTIARHLRTGKRTSPLAEEKHQNKAKETEKLIKFAHQNRMFFDQIEEENYISEGAEQKVYIKNDEYVLKLNDAIYYASWEDYFFNILLHNYFFPDTAYHLMGFHFDGKILYAVVKQAFVRADSLTDLENVKTFLESNGFVNTKNHDYFQPDLGIVLEDLHDENVLSQKGILYFIDTVFYIQPEIFWENS
ncbi:MAG: hypothetical protein Q4G27_05480 [Flavobacteriaceae bacterium]|nr:hypothetical protein [Flavobacteriaceae bacterium]